MLEKNAPDSTNGPYVNVLIGVTFYSTTKKVNRFRVISASENYRSSTSKE